MQGRTLSWLCAAIAASVSIDVAEAAPKAADAPCSEWVRDYGQGGYRILASGDTNGEVDWANTLWALWNMDGGATVYFSNEADEGGNYYFNNPVFVIPRWLENNKLWRFDGTLMGAGTDRTFLEAKRKADPGRAPSACAVDFLIETGLYDEEGDEGGFDHWPGYANPQLLRFDGAARLVVTELTLQVRDDHPADPYWNQYTGSETTVLNTILSVGGDWFDEACPCWQPRYSGGEVILSDIWTRGSEGDFRGKNVLHSAIVGWYDDTVVEVQNSKVEDGGIVGLELWHYKRSTLEVSGSHFEDNYHGMDIADFHGTSSLTISHSVFDTNEADLVDMPPTWGGPPFPNLSVVCSEPESLNTAPCPD